jgi:hypothetical protein
MKFHTNNVIGKISKCVETDSNRLRGGAQHIYVKYDSSVFNFWFMRHTPMQTERRVGLTRLMNQTMQYGESKWLLEVTLLLQHILGQNDPKL